MSERNAVQRAFDEFGKAAGFEKKSGSWYSRGDEVIAVSNLQKSQYGRQYYFNQGFWLRQFGDQPFPKANECHIRARLGQLLREDDPRIKDLLDLESAVGDDERIGELVALLRGRVLPVIEEGRTIAGLRALVADGTVPASLLTGPAQRALTATPT